MPSIWDTPGKDATYEHYRTSQNATDLRKWVDDAYTSQGLSQYLDSKYLHALRNEDFYGRLWELELAEWFNNTGLKLIPTGNKGFDFCIELSDGRKVWIEAVLSRPDAELNEIGKRALASNGALYDTPVNQTALRYTTNLAAKADKIHQKYLSGIGKDDIVLIAISGFTPAAAVPTSRDVFERSIMPVGSPVVHFSRNGEPLDLNVDRPTHELQPEITKNSGALVNTEFVYPGTEYPFIDGVMFSECSNLQQLLGTFSSSFSDDTNTPHVYQNYSGKNIPEKFRDTFYYHEWVQGLTMNKLEMRDPKRKP